MSCPPYVLLLGLMCCDPGPFIYMSCSHRLASALFKRVCVCVCRQVAHSCSQHNILFCSNYHLALGD